MLRKITYLNNYIFREWPNDLLYYNHCTATTAALLWHTHTHTRTAFKHVYTHTHTHRTAQHAHLCTHHHGISDSCAAAQRALRVEGLIDSGEKTSKMFLFNKTSESRKPASHEICPGYYRSHAPSLHSPPPFSLSLSLSSSLSLSCGWRIRLPESGSQSGSEWMSLVVDEVSCL